MRATLWSDYCCPWCYLALDRLDLLGELGVEVTVLPYELHPETPAAGRQLRPGSGTALVFDEVGSECERVGLPFVRPARTPNTAGVLAAAEHVRQAAPDAFPALHRSLFAAHFADGRDLADRAVVDGLVTAAGADAPATRAAVESGAAHAAVDGARAAAHEAGVTGTPALALGATGLVIPGVQTREALTRWVTHLRAVLS